MGALNKIQKQMLRDDGFLYSEIKALDKAKGGSTGGGAVKKNVVPQHLDFNSKPFLAMRRSRRRYIKDLMKLGWSQQEVSLKIKEYYRLGKRDIFSFLKIEYSPPHRLSDYQDAVKRKNRSRISRTFGRLYGRNMRTATKIRTAPRRPVVPNKPKPRFRPRVIRRR
jgi:hypothetical protein